jgi:hypothetical protein
MNKDGGIVDHYCLNFLFIKDSYEKKTFPDRIRQNNELP